MIYKANFKKDKKDIIKLWERNFSGVLAERFNWIYENNPAGVPSCWLAIKDGQLVGSTAIFPRLLYINGEVVTAGIAGDFSVIKEHRGFGPALSLQREAVSNYISEGFRILYSLPNKDSGGILKRVGYSDIGDIIRLTRPLKSQNYLENKINIPVIAKMLSKPIDMAMRKFVRGNFHMRYKDYTWELLTSFDYRFDILWDKAAPQFTVIGERTCSYLNWRFINSPHESYLIFVIKQTMTDEIHGYITFSIARNRAIIFDLLSLNIHILDALLSEFILLLQRECLDAVSINLAGCTDLVKKLQRYGFFIRDREDKLVALFPPDSPFAQYISEIKNWYFLVGDNDI